MCKTLDNIFWSINQSINLIVSRTVMKLLLGYTHNYFQIAPKEEILFIFQVWWLVMIIRNSRLRGFSMKKVKEFEVLVMCSFLPFLVCWLKMKRQISIPNENQGHCITIICLITTILLPLLQSSVSQLIFFFPGIYHFFFNLSVGAISCLTKA